MRHPLLASQAWILTGLHAGARRQKRRADTVTVGARLRRLRRCPDKAAESVSHLASDRISEVLRATIAVLAQPMTSVTVRSGTRQRVAPLPRVPGLL